MSTPSRHGTEDANRSGVPPNLMPEGSPSNGAGHRRPTDGQEAGQSQLGKGETKDAESLECGCTMRGRALVVCLDGTSNQFGKNNTNVIELYHRIIKDKRQLTYYNSGIGTYAKPSWRSFTYWKQVISNKIDTAIAWNLEKIILGAYRWLSANYKEGDRIYLFGFSRGAYQVRALAGMIKKVGLILRGNEEQIPFAYELYADHKSEEYKDPADTAKTFNMAARFKETFSRPGVKVHYIGVWDTVSSIGLARSKSLPLTDTCEHFCYMRHALALDERRVKFQPEYARGGESWVPTPAQQANPNTVTEPHQNNAGPEGENNAGVVLDKPKSRPRVKEVWFAGSHSDIGGGVKSNTELNNASIPALWMGNEAMLAGLDLTASRAEWDWNKLKEDRPTESLSVVWWFLEVFLFKQLSYKGTRSTRRRFHLADPRIIKPGQKIHASVAFVGSGYHPKAKFSKEAPKNQWNHIVGKGNKWNPEWAHGLGDLLELDLFDHSDIPNIMGNLSRESRRDTKVEYLDKLAFMARSQGGAKAIETDSKFEILFNLLNDRNDDASVRITTCSVLEALAHQSRRFTDDRFSTLLNLLDDENSNAGVKIAIRDVLGAIIRNGHIVRDNVTAPTIYRLIVDSDKELQMAGLKALGGFWVGNIPPKASAIICKLVVPMLKDRYGVQRQIAVMALCSCVHKPEIFHGIIKHMNVSDLIDIFVMYLRYGIGGAKVSCVRGLVGLMKHGESTQQAIAHKPRVAISLVRLLNCYDSDLRQAGLQGVLAFGQNDILRPSMRNTNVIRYLSRLAVESDTPDVQRDVLLAFEVLVQDDETAKKAMAYTGNSDESWDSGYLPLPQKIKCQLESDPRFKSKVDEDTI